MEDILYGHISDDAIAALKRRIGVPIDEPQPYIEEASKDSIRHWAHGIGDPNPLWVDENYARKTRYKGIIAPPTILYATSRIVSGYVGGLPGVHAMYAGTKWEWSLPVKINDRITPKSSLKDMIEKKTHFGGRAFQQIYETKFYNQDNKLVAAADSWCFRMERQAAKSTGKYQKEGVVQKKYNREEIEAIKQDYLKEVIRGSTPRYWEDVSAGEEIPQVVKGPLTITGIIVFDQGWGGLYLRAHGLAFDLYRQHPALGIPNLFGIPEPPERIHWDDDIARRVGVPAAFDYGPERVSWIGHLVTNWIGDDGFMKKLNVEVRRHNLIGDTTWCRGKVARKYIEKEQHLVDLELNGVNQRGETSVVGQATAVLPSRGKKS